MTTILPHGPPRDPRTYKEPPRSKAPPLQQRVLRCGRAACETRMDLTGIPEERVRSYAFGHGYVELVDKHGKTALYCSKRCGELHRISPDTAAEIAQPVVDKPASPLPHLAHVPTSRHTGRDGLATREVPCGHPECPSAFDVAGDATDVQVAAAAAAHGYVQTLLGVYCSADCARHASSDHEHGILAPRPLTDAAIAEAQVPRGAPVLPDAFYDETSAAGGRAHPTDDLREAVAASAAQVAPPVEVAVAANKQVRAKSAKLAGQISARRPLYPDAQPAPATPPRGGPAR